MSPGNSFVRELEREDEPDEVFVPDCIKTHGIQFKFPSPRPDLSNNVEIVTVLSRMYVSDKFYQLV